MPAAAALPAAKIAGAAWTERRRLAWLLALIFGVPLAAIMLMIALVAGFAGGLNAPGNVATFAPSAFAVRDIPSDYLTTYQAAGSSVGWEWLAAIGKIETDHGRSRAAGVRSGVNFAGCCAGPMQFLITGAGGGTWGAYGRDGDGDGDKDVYDPADAIPAAAAYLQASGAPADMPRAIYAYNHAGWYVDQVTAMAARYRGAPIGPTGLPAGSDQSQALPPGATWLAAVPGTNATCDRRIVPDVTMLLARYKMRAGDCFALNGHSRAGEHPLGLGIDLYAGPGGSWKLVDKAARDLGWRSGCASTGCAGTAPSPMRFIGWNGYPGHGDPAHAGANAHLHLSWQHTPALPGTPAARVQTLLAPTRPDSTP
ncbi:MAG: hypothetical protein ACR2KP_13815 [Egibacteraceae bacterium]